MSATTIVFDILVGILLIVLSIAIYERIRKAIRRNDMAGDSYMVTNGPDRGSVFRPYSIRDVEFTKEHYN